MGDSIDDPKTAVSEAVSTAGPPVFSCRMCGRTAAGPPLTWMFEHDSGGSPAVPAAGPTGAAEPETGRPAHVPASRWYCDSCARANLRSVEAKLEQHWW